jgi:hypothetical protein
MVLCAKGNGMIGNEINSGLTEKVNEYRMMSAPLNQAISELEYAQSMLKARAESDIAQTVPALGALAEILEISSLDLLMAPDRLAFLQAAMERRELTAEEVGRQMRALVVSPESRTDLKALGIGEDIP